MITRSVAITICSRPYLFSYHFGVLYLHHHHPPCHTHPHRNLRLTPLILISLLGPQIRRTPPNLHFLPPNTPLLRTQARPHIITPIQAISPLLSLLRLLTLTPLVPPTIPLPIPNQIIAPKRKQCEFVVFQILGILCTEVHGGSKAGNDGNFMRVHKCPGAGEANALSRLEEHHQGYDE